MDATDRLFAFVDGTKNAFKGFVDEIKSTFRQLARELAEMFLRLALQRALLMAIGGGTAPSIGNNVINPFSIPGSAHGSSTTVGGTGGPDSQLFMSRVSPNERVDIVTPQRQMQERNGSGGPAQRSRVIVQPDPMAALEMFESAQFEEEVLAVARRNPDFCARISKDR